MQLRQSSLKKFIFASILFHIGLIGISSLITAKNKKPVTVEISFGTGNSRGGSGPKAVAKAAPAPAPKKAVTAPKVEKPVERVKTDAPVVSKTAVTDQVATTESAVAKTDVTPGSGLGTVSGSGSGYTSGSGSGFNDPKIKYRGLIHQLVNSKKVYPRKARALQQEGTVVAKIKLSKDGKLLKVDIVESSAYKILAKATVDAIKGIKKFPAIPKELGLEEITINIPFEYEITNGDSI